MEKTLRKFLDSDFFHQRGAYFFTLLIILLISLSLFAGILTSYSPSAIDLNNRYQAPSLRHFFGTDELGRDVFSRTLYGSRVSLSIGIFSRSIALFFGMLLGLAAGFWGGYTDTIISRLIDSTLAFPSLLLAIAVAFFIGPGYLTLLISLTIVSWAPIARLVRSAVLTVKSESYIEAARAVNASQLRILFTHILPNCRSVIIIAFTSGIAAAIIGESSLSFLGLGPDPSIPTWGQMISTGMKDLFAPPPNHPWLYLFPGFFLFMTVLAFNMAGDLLRDSLDPRFRSQR